MVATAEPETCLSLGDSGPVQETQLRGRSWGHNSERGSSELRRKRNILLQGMRTMGR